MTTDALTIVSDGVATATHAVAHGCTRKCPSVVGGVARGIGVGAAVAVTRWMVACV